VNDENKDMVATTACLAFLLVLTGAVIVAVCLVLQ
jgi:hypothetical protein